MLRDGPHPEVYNGDPTTPMRRSTQLPSLTWADLAAQILTGARSGPAEAIQVLNTFSLGGRWRDSYRHTRQTLIEFGVRASWLPTWEQCTIPGAESSAARVDASDG